MKRLVLISLLVLGAVSCSEVIRVKTHELDRDYLIVEALLTDSLKVDQYVKLSESIPFFYEGDAPKVSGATVVVSDGEEEFLFTEDPAASGEYHAPDGFRAIYGRTYTLSIRADVFGKERHYTASAEMETLGFRLDSIDYAYNGNTKEKLDSLWSVLMWGADDPDTESRFVARISVNGHRIPLSSCLMMEDKYFSGKTIEAFPVGLLSQTADNYKQYGECNKFLEEGDVVSLEGYSMTPDYYNFLHNIQGDSGGASNMPLLATQPENPITNIQCDDGYVLGYFAVCSFARADVTVTDPFRNDYKNILIR